MSDTYNVYCTIIAETPKAVHIQQKDKAWWIPRSIIPHMRRDSKDLPTSACIQVEDWFLDKPENKEIEAK